MAHKRPETLKKNFGVPEQLDDTTGDDLGFGLRFLRKHGWRLLLIFAGVLLPLWGFGALVDALREGDAFPFDVPMLQAVHAIANTGFDRVFIFISAIGYAWGVVPVDVVLILGLAFRRHVREGLFAGIAIVGSVFLNIAAKHSFARARPSLWQSIIPDIGTYSFPSGHAMGSMTLALVVVLLCWHPRSRRGWAWRWPVTIFATIFVLLVGLSRIYLGVHYPSDILAGWTAASVWVVGVYGLVFYGTLRPWQAGSGASEIVQASESGLVATAPLCPMRLIHPMRLYLLVISAAGALLFGALLSLSIVSPITIERWARDAIEHEVETRVGGELHALSQSSLAHRAARLIDAHKQQSAFDRMAIAVLHAEVVRVSAQMLDPNCACRLRMLGFLQKAFESDIHWMADFNSHVTTLIESKYAQVSNALLCEVRIFSAANTLVFVFLWLVAYFRRDAKRQLLAPAFVLLGSASVVGYFYLFQQDWLQTVLIGQYVGMWYFGYLGITVAFLADIVFNKCRVTTVLVNMIGSFAGVLPC